MEEGYSEEEVSENVDALLSLTEHLYTTTNPLYAFGAMAWDHVTRDDVPGDEDLLDGTLETLSWLTVLPEETVDRLGRDRVLAAPAYDVREFDGAVALVLADRPVYRDHEIRETATQVKQFLGAKRSD